MLLLAGDLRGGRGVRGLGECHVRGQRGGGLSCPGRAACDSARSLRLLASGVAFRRGSRQQLGWVRPQQRQVSGQVTFSPQRPGRKRFRKPGAEAVTGSDTCQVPAGGA